MIGRLRGVLLEKRAPWLLLDVHGVGYELEAPMTTFYELPELGQQVELFTHLVVREDAQLLYGFARESERAVFRLLIRISGVGAKLALSILSGMSADELARCVQAGDTAPLVKLPGIGKKTAERLIVEMRDKLPGSAGTGLCAAPGRPMPGDAVSDAVSALVALGYKPQEASRLVGAVDSAGLGSEEIVRAALKGTRQVGA